MEFLEITGDNLTLQDVEDVARKYRKVILSEDAREKIKAARKIIEDIEKESTPVYGVNTGFGSLVRVKIDKEDRTALQENILRTHSVGYGAPLSEERVRAIILTRINSLSKGYSGVTLELVETLVEMLNKNLIPFILEKGSLGASGDLAPLSHMALPLLGLGKAYFEGELLPGKVAMEKAGIPTIKLHAKEGLALINGTTVLTAIGALALIDGIKLSKTADIAAALSIEALRGVIDAFNEELHLARPQAGQVETAKNLRNLLKGSKQVTRQGEIKVQDAYSLRCAPQVHGASKDSLEHVKKLVEIELNSATDNPLITKDGVFSGGNFHGEPLAQAFDLLGIAIAEIGSISERRVERLVNGSLSGYPSFLVKKPGLNSGFMLVQYTAASLVSENKILSHPASVDSIPSCENQEDFVSMGTIAARKAGDIAENVKRILATELVCAAQALDFNDEFKLGEGTDVAYKKIREEISFLAEDKDVELYNVLEKSTAMVASGKILDAVMEKVEL